MCIGPELPNGCEGDPVCVEREVNNEGELCPGVCPVYCEEDWIAVSGGVDTTGCQLHPICVRKYILKIVSFYKRTIYR